MVKKNKILILLTLLLMAGVPVKAENLNFDDSPIYLSNNADLKGVVEEGEITEKHGVFQGVVDFYEHTRTLHDGIAEDGIIFEMEYKNDSGFNLGGHHDSRTGMKSISLFDMSLELDTEKLGWWHGGHFFVVGENVHGHSMSHRIGDLQGVSSIDAHNETVLGKFGYEQSLFDDKFVAIAGKQDANEVFDYLETAQNFVNSSFTLIPNTHMPAYPETGLGFASVIKPVEWFNLKAGIFDGEPWAKDLGFRTAFDSKGGYTTLIESGITPEINGHKGNYFIGYWTHSADIDEIAVEQPARYNSNHGFYASFEQELYREPGKDEGLNIMGQFGWAPSNRNEIAQYYGAGFTYKGLFPHREDDVTGVGIAMTDLSNRYKAEHLAKNESAIELFHKFQLTDSFALQPDVQIITNAGGGRHTAMAVGLRTIYTFAPRTEHL